MIWYNNEIMEHFNKITASYQFLPKLDFTVNYVREKTNVSWHCYVTNSICYTVDIY